ncbi:hypothetical protein LMH87_001509 [Akanthomyces muscarius]|uniref:ubiquitinyl hydrolase 1 n=1 Tax=Akanthomyces muscarius TaxID=2231603 RepID=A0A9W8Q7Q6_AKAMU|nr:hypothetical protein LMH87_001509 [Akanthomyces muscarius]KAJ4146956.1 hypothetical protein LMH87_001509 [Akanthomyces muscarius]
MTRVEAYEIDTLLGSLQDCGSHERTEQALSILNSAAVHSFAALSVESMGHLHNIAKLTPARRYYPESERCMQVVDWSTNLGFLAQHNSYYAEVQALFNRHDSLQIFNTAQHTFTPRLPAMDHNLLDRDVNRSSTVRISGFGAEGFNTDKDRCYAGRGQWQDSLAAKRTFEITRALLRARAQPCSEIRPDLVAHMWKYLQDSHVARQTDTPRTKLEYDAEWFIESKEFISEDWLSIHHYLSHGGTSVNGSDIAMWLATLAFSEHSDMTVLQILAGFHNNPSMASITLPTAYRFDIGRGFEVDENELRAAIRAAAHPIEHCPPLHIVQHHQESYETFRRRQLKQLEKAAAPFCEDIQERLKRQWLCEVPHLPTTLAAEAYFNMSQVMSTAKGLFKNWYDNHRFRQYLEEIARQINRDTLPQQMDSPCCAVEKWAQEGRQRFVNSSAIFGHAAPTLEPFQSLDLRSHLHPRVVSGKTEPAVMSLVARLEAIAGCPYEKEAKLIAEIQNPGHKSWSPGDHPEWLLLEVENNILIREVQHRMAQHMSAPASGQNEIMQLIMGGGKSSVIVPMLASALADGTRLTRVIVAKPQAKQMFSMLVAKLGRLLDRRIYLMPFSRSVRVDGASMEVIQRLYSHCMATGGVLLVQPEHILSFQLMTIEKQISGAIEGRLMLETLQFLQRNSRDIIDESDEILSVKYELVYTMGTQRSIDHAPARWIVISEVLDVVKRCIPAVQARFPEGVEVYPGHRGSFPRTRILQYEAFVELSCHVAESICKKGLSGFSIAHQSEAVRAAVCLYISKPHLAQDERDYVELHSGFMTDETRDTLLLLRGLMALGILSFILEKKRWRVDYGLDPLRQRPTRMAVPFRAKDLPSDRSDFSHPDVVIAFTSLSYYYEGLSDDDLVLSISHLQVSDQADVEYQDWVKDAEDLPSSLHQLVSINLEDRQSCR